MSGDAIYAHSALFVLARALVEARSGRAAEVEPDHLLVGMGTLCRPDLPEILARGQQEPALRRSVEADAQRVTEFFALAGISPRRLRRSLREALAVEGGAGGGGAGGGGAGGGGAGGGGAGGGERQLSRAARRAFRLATEPAGPEKADAVHLLRAVLDELTPVGRDALKSYGISDAPAVLFPVAPDTPHLDLYGRDLSALARAGKLPALFGRGAELRTLARILVRRRKANAVLVGHAGIAHHGVRIEPGAVAAAVDLTIRHLPDQRLPDKVIDALDQACAAARIRTLSPDAAPEPALRIGRDEVAAVVAERARLPLQQVQICDEGRLTDSRGRRVPFSEAVVIPTSNPGSGAVSGRAGDFGFAGASPAGVAPPGDGSVPTGREGVSPAGPGPADYPAHRPILVALRHYFRPELVGRIGRIVVFSPLSEADLRPILDKILDRVHARLATRAITLTLTPAGRALLLRHGTDRRAGARFLEQAVDRLLVQPLARALLIGDIPDGSTVRADAAGEALSMTMENS
ncbi:MULTISPECIES: hypothetical protein [unclassified Streptomyces]|uniref:hypothetical protein n=1 Tax=unclassified Streptomyces TaxID=2593676 RepID=UPI00364BE281